MNHLENGITEHGVNTKFGTVAHGIELPIPTPHSILDVLYFLYEGSLITLPVAEDSREQKFFWWKKNVRALYAERPMCLNTKRILLIDVPAMRILKLSSTFPAGYLLLNIIGCDFHEYELSLEITQCWLTITMVPVCFIVALGWSLLHLKQNREKRQSSLVKKTMNLGSLSQDVPGSTLKSKTELLATMIFKGDSC